MQHYLIALLSETQEQVSIFVRLLTASSFPIRLTIRVENWLIVAPHRWLLARGIFPVILNYWPIISTSPAFPRVAPPALL